MATIGVLLSGCGVYDGSEIHEATLTLYFLDRAGAKVVFCAPDMSRQAVDHATKAPMAEQRDVRREAARLARGPVADVATIEAAALDGLILPGGLGAATNLCDFAVNGAKGTVHPAVAKLLRDMHAARKPIGAICIAPAVLALALGEHHPRLTIGNDAGTASVLEEAGASHQVCGVDETCLDAGNNLVTTPAYMLGPGIADIARGIGKLVAEVLSRAGHKG
jgi:enhancing lycopene biosynthesis protein 2